MREEDSRNARAARLPPAGDRRGRRHAARFLPAGRSEGASTPASSSRSSGCCAARISCSAPSAIARATAAPRRYRISDLELASRLSFFLWSSIPDDELLDVAARGRLSDPAVLEQQVRRMLADRRSNALVDNFAGQWLAVRNVRDASPDPDLFPDFDENLREAFQRETELFVEHIIREDRSVLDLLTADYTFLNERLARHYGIPDVTATASGASRSPTERGGLLGHGSILTVTSYPEPHLTGAPRQVAAREHLGAPPPPPPPDVARA